MRREDIFMDLIGELDDNYIALAMSRPKRRGIVSETSKVTFVQPVEISHEVSKKDMRIYWITRTLGMAAVTVLIVGAVFLLWKNWDKIMVRDPDTPPVVTTDITTVTDPSIITTDIDDSGKSNAPSVTFEEMKQMLYYKGNCITLPCSVFDITRLDSLLTSSAESGEGSSMFFIKRNDELICTLTVATSGTDIDIPEGKQLISLAIRSGEDFSLFDGKIKLGTTLDEVKALLGEPTHSDETTDYSYTFTSDGETIAINDMRFDDDGKLIQMPDISYIGLPADSLYAHKTDNSMPEDPFPYNDPDYYYWFYGMWSRNFSSVRNSVGNLGDPEKRATLDSVNKARNVDTPYTLYDNLNLYWYCNWLGISANELCEAIENDNATYMKMQEEIGYIPDDALYTDEEISVLRSGSRKDLIEQFATEYDIICGEHVFNPKWLYYHILAEYFDAGITPEMVKEMYPLYKQAFYEGSWKMTDEAWAAFDAKLQKYMGMTSDMEEPDSNEEESDRFEQITDTTMPDLLTGNYDDDSYDGFLSPWKIEQRSIPIELMRLVDESNTEKWFESIKPLNTGTPYRINRGYSLYSYITGVGLSWEETEPILLERDFSADEISAMVSGNMELITKNSASEYTIVIGDCAYSPKWLYYHTTEDYKAVGITPGMVGDKLQQYQKLGLPEEMWKAFREKLILYYTYGVFDEASVDKTYIIDSENCKLSGDSAFEILEKVYYGEWEIKGPFEPYKSVLSLTYQQDPFANGMIPVTGMFETDEIYALAFTNGGAAGCLLIEKSAPDVMYWTDILPSGVGLDVVKFGYGLPRTYINRKPAVPEIKSGEISVLGLKKLFNIYGRKFEESFTDLLEKDKSEGVDFDGQKLYPTGKDIYRFGEATPYLGTLTDDEVRILMPYYYEDDSGNATELYAEMWLSKYYNGDWGSGTNVSITPDASGLKINGKPIPNNELEGFDLDALTEIVFASDNKTIKELNKFLDTINDKELVQQYKRAYVLRTVAFASDDVAATLVDDTGKVVAVSTGFTFESVMNAYLQVFKSEYVSDLFADLHFYRYGDELFCAGVSVSTPDCIIEYVFNSPDDSPNLAVFAVMGYAKDEKTGKKTDKIVLSKDAIFELSSVGWRCRHFGISDRTQ